MLLSLAVPVTVLSASAGAATVASPPKIVVVHDLVVTAASRALDAEALVRGETVRTLLLEWQRVAICEVNGDWSMTGPVYSGIGFSNATWWQYGGTRFAPLAGEATRDQQILVGMRVTHGEVPDQDGCRPGGW
jgi:hypothetical protein